MTPLSCDVVSVDVESTGTDPEEDRAVEVAVVRESPDGTRTRRVWRLNPRRPIPAEATAVHGITDADVADAPIFGEVAPEIAAALDGAAVVGFNVRAFDRVLLRREFGRASEPWPCEEAPVVDVLLLDRARTRHTLGDAVRRWCRREHVGAHGALADAEAALDVLRAMRAERDGTVAELEAESGGNAATPCGKVLWREDGVAVWGFGKCKGAPIGSDRGFARWVADKASFPADVRALAARGARGEDVRRTTT